MNSSKTLEPLFKEWAAKSGTPWCVTFPTRGALKSKRRFFTTEAGARSAIALWNNGKTSQGLGSRQVDEVLYCSALLPEGVTLTDAVRFYLQHHSGMKDVTLATICRSYTDDLVAQKKSEKYRAEQDRIVKDALAYFKPETVFSTLSKGTLIAFIKEPKESYWNRYARKRLVSCLITKARELEAVKASPLDGWTFEDAPKMAKHVLHKDDVETILEYALEHSPALVPAFALQFFAGIRTEELCRAEDGNKRPLRWSDIEFGKCIYVPVEVSKTGDERKVPFWPEALTNWLPGAKPMGVICPVENLDDAKSKLIKALNKQRKADGLEPVDFRQNDFRRTFASHCYRLKGQAVAQECLGHSDGKMLKKHYANVRISDEEAEAYFKSKPLSVADNVIPLSA